MIKFNKSRNIRRMVESVKDPHELILSLVDFGSIDADDMLVACVSEMSDAECKRVLHQLDLVQEDDAEIDDTELDDVVTPDIDDVEIDDAEIDDAEIDDAEIDDKDLDDDDKDDDDDDDDDDDKNDETEVELESRIRKLERRLYRRS